MGSSTLFPGATVMVRLFFATMLGILAVAAQFVVIVLLSPGWLGDNTSLPAVLGWQLLATLAAALFFAHVLPGRPQEYRHGVFIHAFCLCLFLPVVGQILFLCMMVAPVIFPPDRRRADSQVIDAPKFMPSLVSHIAYGSGARLRVRLGNQDAPDEDRVAAMIAMRSLPLHLTDGMLRNLLSDPLEEIRLLAYGISNAAEHTVTQKILATSRQMDVAATASKKSRLSSDLAELHWELIYQNLVQGELRRHTLERVERYAHAALALDENNAAMWCLLGRCALLNNKPLQAEVFLRHAQARHFPAHRLLPWMAEAAFMKREYHRIGPILAPLHGGASSPTLRSTVHYWTP